MKILARQEFWIWGSEFELCAPAPPTPMGVRGAGSEWVAAGRLSLGAGSVQGDYANPAPSFRAGWSVRAVRAGASAAVMGAASLRRGRMLDRAENAAGEDRR